MTHQSCIVQRIETRASGYGSAYKAEADESTPRSRWSTRRLDLCAPRRFIKTRSPHENVPFYADSQGCQRVTWPRRVCPYPSAPTAVTPELSIEPGTLAIYLLAPLACERGPALQWVSS
jgi:hypothetical protein